MKKKSAFLVYSLTLLLIACSDKQFDATKWKESKDYQYYMLEDIIINQRLIGKTKAEIVTLLDTTDIKQFDFDSQSWMYVISIPHTVPVTKNSVAIMDIEFENNKVNAVKMRD